jgi:3-phosphoshikimate 1-carboxyvinyltransferase
MRHFGVNVDVSGQEYTIAPQNYSFNPFWVEADWSGASYWYSLFALSQLDSLIITGLKPNSTQGDSVLQELMLGFGVQTEFSKNEVTLTKKALALPESLDFINCPDLAQTFAVLCAATGHECTFYGLQTLKIKETDRVMAIRTELQKLGGDFIEEDDSWVVRPIPIEKLSAEHHYNFSTYEDHRMAMAFAPLAANTRISFDDRDVVNKSYPTFWQDMQELGLKID